MREDEHVNEHFGLSVSKDELDALLNEYQNEKNVAHDFI